jgi:hypothetical protein
MRLRVPSRLSLFCKSELETTLNLGDDIVLPGHLGEADDVVNKLMDAESEHGFAEGLPL